MGTANKRFARENGFDPIAQFRSRNLNRESGKLSCKLTILVVPAIPVQEWIMFIANAFQREWANNQTFLVTRLINALNILTL